MLTEPESVLFVLADAFDEAHVDYAVGGSVASSRFGEPRATLDTDVMIDPTYDSLTLLLNVLSRAFWVDRERAREAYQSASAFQAVHISAMAKVDLFVVGDDPSARAQIERRTALRISTSARDRDVWFVSAEDIVVQKLKWFVASSGVLERQLRDVAGVIRLQGERLDRDYLTRTAARLGLTEFLVRAMREAGQDRR